MLSGSLLLACPASAQDVTIPNNREFALLQEKLRNGDPLIVGLENGTTVSGRLIEISGERLALMVSNVRRDIQQMEIIRVQRRKNGVLLGALVGLGTGIGFATVVIKGCLSPNVECDLNLAGVGGSIIGIGVGAGIGIDALVVRTRTLYDRQTQPRATVRPILDSKRLGMQVKVTF